MNRNKLIRNYWDDKILVWENNRYSLLALVFPASWPIRLRLVRSANMIIKKSNSDWSVLEIGCGSGKLAKKILPFIKKYVGVDISKSAINLARKNIKNSHSSFNVKDINQYNFGTCDLTIFLGVTDWLSHGDLEKLFYKIKSPNILFSYTQQNKNIKFGIYSFYRLFMDRKISKSKYSALSYTEEFVNELLRKNNFNYEVFKPRSFFNPGVLIWAQRQ